MNKQAWERIRVIAKDGIIVGRNWIVDAWNWVGDNTHERLQIVLTVGAMILAYCVLRETQHQVEEARTQTKTADSTLAFLRQTQVLRDEFDRESFFVANRAYVSIEIDSFHINPNDTLAISWTVKNTGQTPAYSVSHEFHASLMYPIKEEKFIVPIRPDTGITLGSGESFSTTTFDPKPVTIPQIIFEEIYFGRLPLYMSLTFSYQTLYDRRYSSSLYVVVRRRDPRNNLWRYDVMPSHNQFDRPWKDQVASQVR